MNTVKRGGLKSWMKSMMFRHIHGMMSCQEFEDFLQAYVDDELEESSRSVFERHIRFCRECREYLNAYQRTIALGSSVFKSTEQQIPSDVPEDLIRAIMATREKS